MKTNYAFLLTILLFSNQLFGQDSKFKLSLRFAPNISMTRVVDKDENDQHNFQADGAGLRFSAGVLGEQYFNKNYAFYSGLWYTSYRSSLKFSSENITPSYSGSTIRNIQYVQIPLALKMLTNEIATDMRMYFVIGGTAGFRISEKEVEFKTTEPVNADGVQTITRPRKSDYAYILPDLGVLTSIGVEYQLGENTAVFGGLSYNRGLLNVASTKGPFVHNLASSRYYRVSHSLISLEMGIRF